MDKVVSINESLVPKTYKEFKVWHKLACHTDILTTEERWAKMGNRLPEKPKKEDGYKRTKKEVE